MLDTRLARTRMQYPRPPKIQWRNTATRGLEFAVDYSRGYPVILTPREGSISQINITHTTGMLTEAACNSLAVDFSGDSGGFLELAAGQLQTDIKSATDSDHTFLVLGSWNRTTEGLLYDTKQGSSDGVEISTFGQYKTDTGVERTNAAPSELTGGYYGALLCRWDNSTMDTWANGTETASQTRAGAPMNQLNDPHIGSTIAETGQGTSQMVFFGIWNRPVDDTEAFYLTTSFDWLEDSIDLPVLAPAAPAGDVRPPFHHHRFHNRAA